MSEEKVVQKGYRISGRVQGVFFRAWTRQKALEIGLAGTVMNRPDGTVEAHLRGPETKVARLEGMLWDGPPASMVEAVEVLDSSPPLTADGFEILH